jgi:hypothetical protein
MMGGRGAFVRDSSDVPTGAGGSGELGTEGSSGGIGMPALNIKVSSPPGHQPCLQVTRSWQQS